MVGQRVQRQGLLCKRAYPQPLARPLGERLGFTARGPLVFRATQEKERRHEPRVLVSLCLGGKLEPALGVEYLSRNPQRLTGWIPFLNTWNIEIDKHRKFVVCQLQLG